MEQMQVKLDFPGLEILGLPHIIPLLLPRDLPQSISHSRGVDSPDALSAEIRSCKRGHKTVDRQPTVSDTEEWPPLPSEAVG